MKACFTTSSGRREALVELVAENLPVDAFQSVLTRAATHHRDS